MVSCHTQQKFCNKLRPTPASAHGADRIKTNVPSDLSKAGFVFIRREAKRSPLQTPYSGPYEVLTRSDKYYTIKVGTRQENITIDRLKAAHVDTDYPVPVAQPPRRGRPPLQTDVTPPQNTNKTTSHLPQAKQTSRTPTLMQDPLKKTYAEVTTRAGRFSRPPQRYRE